jgi:hypothetical protein
MGGIGHGSFGGDEHVGRGLALRKRRIRGMGANRRHRQGLRSAPAATA